MDYSTIFPFYKEYALYQYPLPIKSFARAATIAEMCLLMRQTDKEGNCGFIISIDFILHNQVEKPRYHLSCGKREAVQNVQSLALIMNSLFRASHINKSRSHMLKVEKPSVAPQKHAAPLPFTYYSHHSSSLQSYETQEGTRSRLLF